jgi:hypothetical protein
MLDRSLRNSGRTRRFVIAQSARSGWEVWEEEDSQVVRSVLYSDWHRVERARRIIGLKMSDLAEHGWSEI